MYVTPSRTSAERYFLLATSNVVAVQRNLPISNCNCSRQHILYCIYFAILLKTYRNVENSTKYRLLLVLAALHINSKHYIYLIITASCKYTLNLLTCGEQNRCHWRQQLDGCIGKAFLLHLLTCSFLVLSDYTAVHFAICVCVVFTRKKEM